MYNATVKIFYRLHEETQSSSSSNGGGTFSAAMIIATVATTELNEEELGHMKGANDKRKRER